MHLKSGLIRDVVFDEKGDNCTRSNRVPSDLSKFSDCYIGVTRLLIGLS
jgi:hypothetical protein